jgi:DNA-binding XRE family transcriptional regulator
MHTYSTPALAPAAISSLNSSSHRPFSFTSNRAYQPAQAPVVESCAAASDLLPRDISSRFGLRLREMRRAANMTQLRMAVDFGIDRSFISDVERGRKSISLHMLEVIALGMKVSLSDLFRGL